MSQVAASKLSLQTREGRVPSWASPFWKTDLKMLQRGNRVRVLGRNFDPTMLLNGSYVIRLSSTTAAGTATAQLGAVVRKNLKIGNVSLAFSDATIAAGLPITLVRSYDGCRIKAFTSARAIRMMLTIRRRSRIALL